MAPTPAEIEQLCAYFQSAGVSATRSLEVAKNPKTSAAAHALFTSNKIEDKGLSEKQSLLVLQVAKDGAKLSEDDRNYIVAAVVDGRLKGADQVTGKPCLNRTQGEQELTCALGCQLRSSTSPATQLRSTRRPSTRRAESVRGPIGAPRSTGAHVNLTTASRLLRDNGRDRSARAHARPGEQG